MGSDIPQSEHPWARSPRPADAYRRGTCIALASQTMRSVHRMAVALAVLGLLQSPGARAEEQPITDCPAYARLLREAADALRQGERDGALLKLREARAALDACSRATSSSRALG
jgi:hypothetical protein